MIAINAAGAESDRNGNRVDCPTGHNAGKKLSSRSPSLNGIGACYTVLQFNQGNDGDRNVLRTSFLTNLDEGFPKRPAHTLVRDEL